ncbi:zinc-dependent alcohol dehydrogenase family protein [Mucilaginibacter sp. SG564]|uniref:zinc-dependent alcohol dehydrogenase family protein n=1 Tax=Mucilaginibacter sp. SG564 TaxID=2587022 RepID=UPI0015554C78|nr:zinc-dependent alcohol dehydrogenase family protein [Mucilaginibacter sp. SG564]NOW95920.1 NADPH2:quinone reductase [Mucilaginibacter sp. SG564]
MKALILNNYGAGLDLQELDKPVAAKGEVLIKIKSSGLNPLDIKIMAGQAGHAQTKLPAVLGIDVSGIVEAVGEGVTRFKAGDEVYGMIGGIAGNQGSLAEYVAADENFLALKPKNLSFHDAAAVPLIFITACEAIVDRANIHEGQKILIHGGAGGVGHIAAQIAKAKGAEVYATVRKHHFEQIKGYGAIPIEYTESDPESYVDEYTGGQGFDIILDNVGGKTLDDSFKAVKRYTGHVVSILGWGTHSLAPLSFRGATYSGVFTLYPLISGIGRAHQGEIMRQATALIEAGKIKPVVSKSVYQLESAMEAYQEVEAGAKNGKVVVDLD